MKVKITKRFFASVEKKYFNAGDEITDKDTSLTRLKQFVAADVGVEVYDEKPRARTKKSS